MESRKLGLLKGQPQKIEGNFVLKAPSLDTHVYKGLLWGGKGGAGGHGQGGYLLSGVFIVQVCVSFYSCPFSPSGWSIALTLTSHVQLL